jgi:FixJ family two-component response regulator
MAERIIGDYTVPSVLVSDYYISPESPPVFLSRLKARGYTIPTIIISAKADAETLNRMTRNCQYLGFLKKGDDPANLVERLASLLNDITDVAIESFESHQAWHSAKLFVRDMPHEKLEIAEQILQYYEIKEVVGDVGLQRTAVGKLRESLLAFMKESRSPLTAVALLRAVRERMREFSPA